MRHAFLLVIGVAVTGMLSAQPSVNNNGVVNSSNYSTTNPIGSLVTIFGKSMSSSGKLLVASSTPLSMQLQSGSEDFSATINGMPAPVYYVTSTQASVQVPWETIGGSANIVVTSNGSPSQQVSFHAATFSPGIFTVNQAGTGQAWAIYACAPGAAAGSCPAPATPSVAAQPGPGWNFPNIAAVPAKAGDRIYLYATGLGPVSPTVADGAAPCPLAGCVAGDKQSPTKNPVQVLIGGMSAPVSFAGLAPQFPGIYQVNFTIPSGAPSGNAILQIEAGGITSSSNTTLAIQ